MADDTRETTCGHLPYHAKALCKRCYFADYYARHGELIRERARRWTTANPGGGAAGNRRRKAADPERERQYQRDYYEARRDMRIASVRAWREANPEKVRENARQGQQRRRARMYGAGAIARDEWQAILVEFDHRCAYCNVGGVPLEMEHMTPLARGGRHTAANVVPSCLPCNREKHTKTAFEFVGPRRPRAEDR